MGWAEEAKRIARAATEPDPAPLATITPITTGTSAYGRRALEDEAQRVATAPEGQRNDALNRAAFSLGQLVASGHLSQGDVDEALRAAARQAGLVEPEISRTLASGHRSGTQLPRDVTPLPDIPVNIAEVPYAALGGASAPGVEDSEERPRTSWWASPVGDLADETLQEPPPDILIRADGAGLAYRGKINGLLGESESGKSWLALHGAHQLAAAGGHVLILDFEDTPRTTRNRLDTLGCPAEVLPRIRYASPDEALTVLAAQDLAESLQGIDLVVVDGVNAAMTLLGLDLNSNTDATIFHTKLLKPLTTHGAGVLTVDHVPKDVEKRGKGGIGAQAKRAMISGCAIRVEVADPFGKGQDGRLKLWVDKDRPGLVRGNSGGAKYAGTFTMTSRNNDTVDAQIEPPDTTHHTDHFRPTRVMEQISEYLELMGAVSKNGIETAIAGRRETVRQALGELIRGGYVAQEQGSNRALTHRSVKPFSASIEEVSA
ncbi:MAG: AAA family ATPase [Micropruina sp.]|nr:AAA family ATPase [Micropruina sp.]